MWWDLKMDVEGSVWIDMAPNNVVSPTAPFLPDDGGAGICSKQPLLSQQPRPWRDHWMQALYFISNPDQTLEKGRKSTLIASHDEYSLMFDLSKDTKMTNCDQALSTASDSPPILSRSKLGFLNSVETWNKLTSCLQKIVESNSVICCIGEGSWLPIICASLGAEKVCVSEWVI